MGRVKLFRCGHRAGLGDSATGRDRRESNGGTKTVSEAPNLRSSKRTSTSFYDVWVLLGSQATFQVEFWTDTPS